MEGGQARRNPKDKGVNALGNRGMGVEPSAMRGGYLQGGQREGLGSWEGRQHIEARTCVSNV